MGQYPVIFLSLKEVAGRNFEEAYGMLCMAVKKEVFRLQFLLESDKLTGLDKQAFGCLCGNTVSPEILKSSLWTISNLLYKHFGKKVILLIDEYDVPLDKAYDCGYYDEMAAFIRGMFDMALKTNDFLQFAVLTGCLRISKESIFTGLNNFSVHTITNPMFDEYFWFTDREVRRMLEYYGLMDSYNSVKAWYDGYRFGRTDVYCPWDVISYVRDLLADKESEPQLYWMNTSSNSIVRRLISRANKNAKREIEQLISGESIVKEIKEELTCSELDKSIENLWSVLFTTGYLTWQGKEEGKKYRLTVPNREIHEIFVTQIKEWFAEEIVEKDRDKLHELCMAFKDGNAQKVQELFNGYLLKTISIRDTYVRKEQKENFYHGILLGLLSSEGNWLVHSNAESGEGYSDILVEIEEEQTGLVIEVKYAEKDALDSMCQAALEQIDNIGYAEKLKEEGVSKIYQYGVACYKKHCKVLCRELK